MDPELTGPEWILAAINDKPVAGGRQVTLIFSEVNNVSRSTGCKLYAGRYVFREGNALNFKPIVTVILEVRRVISCSRKSHAPGAFFLLKL
jgi:hypothetical protein